MAIRVEEIVINMKNRNATTMIAVHQIGVPWWPKQYYY